MRLTLVVPTFPKLSESFIANKFAGLVANGHDVIVVCQQGALHEWDQFPVLRSNPKLRKLIRTAWPHRPRWLLAVLVPLAHLHVICQTPKCAGRYLWRGWKRLGWPVFGKFYLDAPVILARPELLHFEFGTLAAGSMHLPELLGCKSVTSFRGYDLNYVGLESPGYYKDVWLRTDAIHCLGEDLWKRAQRRGCPPDKPRALIPPAIDPSFFMRQGEPETVRVGTPQRPARLLSVGRLEWKKGYEYAMRAVQLLRAQGVAAEYRIIGAGEFMEAISFCQHQLGLKDVVTLLGAGQAEMVRTQMEWADIFVHAAVSEGFCNAVLEAQAMELPVVTSDADGLAENVANDVTGFVVQRRDAAAMAEKIRLLAADGSLRRRMGAAGRKRVAAHYRLTEQINAFDRLYQRVLSGNLAKPAMAERT